MDRELCWYRRQVERKRRKNHHHSRTCVSKPVEAATHSPGHLPVGSGRVGAAGVAGRGCGVHLGLTHVEETHVQLEVAAPTGLGHVGAEHGLWGGRAPEAAGLKVVA